MTPNDNAQKVPTNNAKGLEEVLGLLERWREEANIAEADSMILAAQECPATARRERARAVNLRRCADELDAALRQVEGQ